MSVIDSKRADAPSVTLDERGLRRAVVSALARWPSAGLAVALVRDDSLEWFFGHGVAEVASRRPVSEDTVFRVGSLTKTITAVAVMQLHERGLVDLDAPASECLRAFQLVPARATFAPVTVRHLLTHTAGVGYWRRLSDVLHPGVGSGDMARSLVPLGEYYRGGLLVDVEPGTRWAYSNHGFATLGQIVEDVSGQPFDEYLREHVFGPLGMGSTDLVVSDDMRAKLATGYVMRSRGLRPVPFREIPTPGGGGLFSTPGDMANYVGALLHGGANAHGRVLAEETVSSMFCPHFQPHPALAGMGLGFELHEEGDRLAVAKGGTVNGFLSAIEMIPAEGLGVVVLSNTGGIDNRGVSEPLASMLVRFLLGLPDDPIRNDLTPRPELWRNLCGWYAPDAGPVTNLFSRVTMGAGAQVSVHRGHLVLKPMTPIPAMRAGMVLHPDDPDDPKVFRIVYPGYGKMSRVVFTDDAPPRLLLDVMSFQKRPDVRNPRRWLTGIAGAGAAAAVMCHRRATRSE